MVKELPATNWLGYSLDVLTASPTDIKSVAESVKTAFRIIDYYPDEDTRPVEIGDVTFDVPRCIGVATDVNNTQGRYVAYSSGTEASEEFQLDASASINYLAFSGSASASYATEKTFKQEFQFAFYSFNADTYMAKLRNYGSLLNEKDLKKRVKQLPQPFNGNDDLHVKKWREFFSTFGTHVIISCSYGARCQLTVRAANSESSVNERWSANVRASYDGAIVGGSVDVGVKQEKQYKTFMNLMMAQVAIRGGNQKLAAAIGINPYEIDKDEYKEWAKSTATYSELTNVHLVELWSLLRSASAAVLRDAADSMQDAFAYLTMHTEIHRTLVMLTIESDWAEFALLTPTAIVSFEELTVPDNTVRSETRVRWGKEHSHKYERKDIKFYVINDGSPIDFCISHGSKAGDQGKGTATVIIGKNHYTNNEITDNNWNTVWYYQRPVSPETMPTRKYPTRLAGPRSWNNLLNDYLKEHGDSSRHHHEHGHGAWSDFQEVKEDLPRGKRLFRSTAPNYNDQSGEDEVQSIGESDVEFLQSQGITAIISLNEYSYDDDSLKLLKEHKISYLHRSVVGHHSPTRDDFNVAKKFFLLQPATLVHCGDGKGRTGTLVTAIQLFASKGAEPPEVDWARVNHVQSDEQVSQLRALREVVQEPPIDG